MLSNLDPYNGLVNSGYTVSSNSELFTKWKKIGLQEYKDSNH